MTEKRVSVRLSAVGGKQVRAELEGVGEAGSKGFGPEGANRDSSASRFQPSWNAAANGNTMVFARHDLGLCSVRLLGGSARRERVVNRIASSLRFREHRHLAAPCVFGLP
jgi:hypothetical protein